MRSPLICSRELRYRSRKIAVFGKRYAPGKITRREVRSERHGFDVRFLGARPITADHRECRRGIYSSPEMCQLSLARHPPFPDIRPPPPQARSSS